jgi:alkanesulfonate monooxygenase SsuD/methylene tetrahydromethanopterin reductase-like flavin-dependent oxidoreductase (luciferase family)
VGGHSPAAARRAGRIGDGFFPFGVGPDEMPPLLDLVRSSAEEAGRDPEALEITVQCNATDGEEARGEVEALQELGATRILVPAVLFGSDLQESLARYGEEVIGGTR